MRTFAGQHFMDVWYAHLDVDAALGEYRSQLKTRGVKRTQKMLAQAHTRDAMQALSKLTTVAGGQRRIISNPPLIEPIEDIFADAQAAAIYEQIRAVLGSYRRSLQSDRQHLLGYFTLVQVARKVVGVGERGPGVRVGGDDRRAERVPQEVQGVGVRVRECVFPGGAWLMSGGRGGGADPAASC
jgi:hypothetical protein